ncbi:hypothetical protein J5N97_027552 [Dioscorea zingiberensis]|uniref:NADP-dependent oxidoreductase domain-containing protein n=1 Tax=Dioscorea zingiberensis TaxID=325984 RepID=A0A9D5C520_9LILI|nr:hypothetical protein J5N97_027552 [Dioscorea zingiberensis]
MDIGRGEKFVKIEQVLLLVIKLVPLIFFSPCIISHGYGRLHYIKDAPTALVRKDKGLNDNTYPDASELDNKNALALAIVPIDNPSTTAPSGGLSTENTGTTGWELALVTASSSNENVAGGLDKLTLDSLYEQTRIFHEENLEHNARLFERVNEIAKKKGCSTAQLALAWVHHQGDDVCPIPGTTKVENFNQNIGALSVKLTPEEMAELESIASANDVRGDRYPSGMPTWRDSETPPLSSWKAE